MMSHAATKPTEASLPIAGRMAIATLAVVLLISAFALHWNALGSPVAGLDEQFYLLVGDRIWHGALPYADIWDRKPAGLFLLYAAIRALPGDGILAYQCVGTVSLAATALVTAVIARRVVPAPAALLAGLLVILYCTVLGLGFGEAPIFYDLLIAIAALFVLETRDGLSGRAVPAMLLCGVALTLKTSAVFESVAFGLLLLAEERHLPVLMRARRAASYALAGLAPTLAIAGFYAAIGAWQAFWFANFQSVFLRSGGRGVETIAPLVAVLLVLAPLASLALAEGRGVRPRERTVLLAWLVAATASFLALGFFHFHYALPMVTPLAVLAARAFRRVALAVIGILGVAAIMVSGAVAAPGDAAIDRADVAALVAAIPDGVRTQCMLVYEGPTILYHLKHACLASRYAFPGHFTAPEERDALEKPPLHILADALAKRPLVIVTVPDLRRGGPATDIDAMLAAALARDYRMIATQDVRLYGNRRVTEAIWRRDTFEGALFEPRPSLR